MITSASEVVAHVADLMRAHGANLLIGNTIVLGSFALGVMLARAPARRHRLAGTALLASAAYVALALAPLPRLTTTEPAVEPAASPPAHVAEKRPTTPATSPARPEPAATQPAAAPTTTMAPPPLRRTASVEAAVLATRPAPPLDAFQWLAAAALLLAGAFTSQLLVGWLRLRAVLRVSRPASRRLQSLVALPRRTRVRISDRAGAPFCCGVFRPTIVLPPTLARGGDAARFVLLHERAHVLTGDPALRALAACLRPLLFWHPLYWWLQRQLRFTGELLADDAAAEGAVAAYARCMLQLAERSTPAPTTPLVATVFRRRSELYRRLETMLTRNEPLPRPMRAPLWLRALSTTTLVGLCAGAFGVERAVAQDPAPAELRNEIDTLRATIATLKAELARVRQERNAAPVADTARDPRGAGATYTVQRGDTLARIAVRCYGNKQGVDRLLELNPGLVEDRLEVGQQLVVGSRRKPDAPEPLLAEVPYIGKVFGHAPQADAANAPTPVSVDMTPPSRSASRSNWASAPRVDSASTGSLSELVDLVTRCIELDGECDIRKVELDDAKFSMKHGADKRAGKRDYEIAEVRLRTTERQRDALRAILKQQLESARARLEHTEKLHENGYIGQQELVEAQSRVRALERGMR